MHAINRRLAHQTVAFHMHNFRLAPCAHFHQNVKILSDCSFGLDCMGQAAHTVSANNPDVGGSRVVAFQSQTAQMSVVGAPIGPIDLIYQYHLTCRCCHQQSHSKVTTKLQITAV